MERSIPLRDITLGNQDSQDEIPVANFGDHCRSCDHLVDWSAGIGMISRLASRLVRPIVLALNGAPAVVLVMFALLLFYEVVFSAWYVSELVEEIWSD